LTTPPTPVRYQDARTFARGLACGFLAGAFAVCLVAWLVGLIESRSAADLRFQADQPSAEHPVDQSPSGPGMLERAGDRIAALVGRDGPGRPAASERWTSSESAAELVERHLEMPVQGVHPDQLARQFNEKRGEAREHQALDIPAPRNTPVRAVEGGRIARLFLSKPGGITVYQFDPSERYCYYYAHLERYADGLHEGDLVSRGQILGYVGTSGNAPKDAPHLHFAIFRLTAEKHWWEGTPIDPYDVLH
jgi:murein DD-endopeptidase MepM/ murein hydrolase activator NlpD